MGIEIFDLMRKKGVKFDIYNFDEEREKDIISGNGFIINESALKKKQKTKGGIQSSLFGTTWEDEESFVERYSCDCGELQGKIYLNETCKKCNTKVKFRDVNYNIFGWIVIENQKVIHPLWFKILETALGKKVLDEIIKSEKPTDIDGKVLDDGVTPQTPFFNIGLPEFERRFIEVITYYKKKKKNKKDMFIFILKHKKEIFTHSIPVMSSVLRPFMIKGDTLSFNEIDKNYNPIVSIANKLNNSTDLLDELEVSFKLYRIQTKLDAIWETTFDIINQKDGFIKESMLGGRLNYSARNVIIPNPTLKANEVILGYKCFMELYKQEIISLVTKICKITENEAHNRWYDAMINYNDVFYQVMKHIIKYHNPAILLNRNPT